MAKITHRVTQGDSYAYDFWSADVPTFDGNWSGAWAIVDSDGAVQASGTLDFSVDSTKLEMRIVPTDTVNLLGEYTIYVQIDNSAISFRQEVMQDRFTVREQGIIP